VILETHEPSRVGRRDLVEIGIVIVGLADDLRRLSPSVRIGLLWDLSNVIVVQAKLELPILQGKPNRRLSLVKKTEFCERYTVIGRIMAQFSFDGTPQSLDIK
jgi:hypothetical protein